MFQWQLLATEKVSGRCDYSSPKSHLVGLCDVWKMENPDMCFEHTPARWVAKQVPEAFRRHLPPYFQRLFLPPSGLPHNIHLQRGRNEVRKNKDDAHPEPETGALRSSKSFGKEAFSVLYEETAFSRVFLGQEKPLKLCLKNERKPFIL